MTIWQKLAAFGRTQSVPFRQTQVGDFIDEHVLAQALHHEFWTDEKPHIYEPGDGDDCNICYDSAARVLKFLETDWKWASA